MDEWWQGFWWGAGFVWLGMLFNMWMAVRGAVRDAAAAAKRFECERIRCLLMNKSAWEKEFAAEKCGKDSQAQRMHENISAEFRIFVRKELK